jgi:S1-C subfamily serine protease
MLFSGRKFLFSAGIIGIAIIIIAIQCPVRALSAKEVQEIAKQVTVKFETQEGSGVIIAKKGNTYYVATAEHVLASNFQEFSLVTPDRIKYWLKPDSIIKYQDDNYDLAIVKFTSDRDYLAATIGNFESTVRGENAYVAGYPRNSDRFNFSNGIFTALKLTQSVLQPYYGKKYKDGYNIVYDVQTVPGMSGGGVFNSNGELIAIHGLGDEASYNENRDKPKLNNGIGISVPNLIKLVKKMGINTANANVISNNRSLKTFFSEIFNKSSKINARVRVKPQETITKNARGEVVTEIIEVAGSLDIVEGYYPDEIGTATIIGKHEGYYWAVVPSDKINTHDNNKKYELSIESGSRQVFTKADTTMIDDSSLLLIKFKSNQEYILPGIDNFSEITANYNIYISGFLRPSRSIQIPILDVKLGKVKQINGSDNRGNIYYFSDTRTGMRGGSIFDHNGKLIGINFGKLHTQKDGMDLNYGIKINKLLEMIDKYKDR